MTAGFQEGHDFVWAMKEMFDGKIIYRLSHNHIAYGLAPSPRPDWYEFHDFIVYAKEWSEDGDMNEILIWRVTDSDAGEEPGSGDFLCIELWEMLQNDWESQELELAPEMFP